MDRGETRRGSVWVDYGNDLPQSWKAYFSLRLIPGCLATNNRADIRLNSYDRPLINLAKVDNILPVYFCSAKKHDIRAILLTVAGQRVPSEALRFVMHARTCRHARTYQRTHTQTDQQTDGHAQYFVVSVCYRSATDAPARLLAF